MTMTGFVPCFLIRLLQSRTECQMQKHSIWLNLVLQINLKKKLVYDVNNTPNSFLFDETTNSQVKKLRRVRGQIPITK